MLRKRVPKGVRRVLDWVVTIALAAVFVLVFEAKVAKPYRIPTSSMEPTLHCAKPGAWCLGSFNDRVVANRLAYDISSPERGQIVVFKAPPTAALCGPGDGGTTFVKRLIGLPGDTIVERSGYFVIDGKRLNDSYVDPAFRDRQSGVWHVPAGRYFFLGDDRIHSCDSRIWGSVKRSSLIGPVIGTYWPPSRIAWNLTGW
ncbi:MAG TPA: signal peptidase I [Gaiellaceae bacterium]